ncbi:hypothetical protein P0G10_20520, partial [Eubacteriales bacterium DFI.9.88]|nr:hypothetical protein [Eubacteriales bacterium DFI.9.88]
QKPVLVLGRGAAISGAGQEACGLAKKADIQVVTSPDGKALMDETDELWSGIVGEYGMDCANRTVMDDCTHYPRSISGNAGKTPNYHQRRSSRGG